jgi:8-oxo-dGTP diphosphatase
VSQREFPSAPLVGVGAVIVNPRGQVLIIQRGTEPRKGHWSIPGGLVDLGETLLDGVRREAQEETGLIVEPQAIVEVVDRIYKDSGADPERIRYHYVIVDYWCTVVSGEVEAASDASAVAWISPEQWRGKNPYSLESITAQVIEKGWKMAQAAGTYEEIESH